MRNPPQRFAMVGVDPKTLAFCQAALAAGNSCVAYLAGYGHAPGIATASNPVDRIAALPTVDFIVVGGSPSQCASHLSEVLQFTNANLVVTTPAGCKPETLYEFALARSETGIRALFLSEELDHPAIAAVKAKLADERSGATRWLEVQVPIAIEHPIGARFSRGWTWVREIAGEVLSLTATSPGLAAEALPETIRQAAANFETDQGVIGTIRFIEDRSSILVRIETTTGLLELETTACLTRPAELRWTDDSGTRSDTIQSDEFGARWLGQWNALVAADDKRLSTHALRQLEVSDAVERSLRRRRPVALDQEEFSEAAGFKSVMTTWGCGLIWATILIAILAAAGVPYIQYLVLPVMILFLGLQSFGWLLKKRRPV